MQVSLPPALSSSLSYYVNGVGDIERVGDHAENLIELFEYKIEHDLPFSDLAVGEFQMMIELAERSLAMAVESLDTADSNKAKQVLVLEEEIDVMERSLRKSHIERLNQGVCNPGSAIIFIDILSNLERVGDHANNIALIVLDINKIRQEEA
jgi:phosphate:Na+ symporter